jgi:deoxyadenosine/deoxycytidine kinase
MIIAIEGNIGSGKSTQLNKLEILKKYNIVKENVEEWVENGWLQDFYKNPKENSFRFQMRVLLSRLNYNIIHQYKKINIVERCPQSSVLVFGKNLLNDKILSQNDYHLMEKLLKTNNIWKPDIIIYIDTNFNECEKRINSRNRDGENIPISYLENVESLYYEYLDKSMCRVFKINGLDTEDNIYKKIISIINDFNF